MINNEIVKLGLNYEKHRGKCNNKVPVDYQSHYNAHEEARTRREVQVGVREVASCQPDAGIIPCDLIEYYRVKHEKHFYYKIKKLITYIGTKCNAEWRKKMEILLLRFNNSITCPGGQPDHNPDLMTAKRANTDFAYDYDQVYGY